MEWIMAGVGQQFNAWIESWLAAVNTKGIEEEEDGKRICRWMEQATTTYRRSEDGKCASSIYFRIFVHLSPETDSCPF